VSPRGHGRLLIALALALALLAAGAVLALGAVGSGGGRGARAATATSAEIAYLAAAQNPDGGFGAAPGQPSTELYSAWAAIGLAAAGRDPLSLRSGGHTVLDALRAEAGTLQGAGDLERTILALRACGASVRSLRAAGDPLARLVLLQRPDGSFGGLSNLTAFGVLALRAAGRGPHDQAVRRAARWLARQQNASGGFGFATRGGPSDVDDTAAAAQALAAAAMRGGGLSRAATYLVHAQNLDGGMPQQPGEASNAQSTSWAIQGLVAAGRRPSAVTRAGSRSPVGYLLTLLAPDGSIRYSRTGAQTPVWVTAQALTGIAARPLPVSPPPRR
jgi:hypothetical protein